MLGRTKEALAAIGLSSIYIEKFKEKKMDDNGVCNCLKYSSLRKYIRDILQSEEYLAQFEKAFMQLTTAVAENPQLEALGSGSPTSDLDLIHEVVVDTCEDRSGSQLSSDSHFTSIGASVVTDTEIPAASSKSDYTTESEKNQSRPPLLPPTEPVQIVDISPHDASNSHEIKSDRLVLKTATLKEILLKVGSRRVAVLSIAGPSRQGKSFILNYMIKYLKHSPSSDSDWLGKSSSKRTEAMTNGFKWRFGSQRETVGIWMWPEPFPMKSADGTEFDILLVDTQGVFDPHTDKKDWGNIVGLSLLTSSCLIFNIMTSLQEDSLITLKDFMDFGKMAINPEDAAESDGDTPFQKLVILIRDWRYEDEHAFGALGGSTYLAEYLSSATTESGRELRDQIKQRFQHLSCYLMPKPGDNVERKIYDGSVAGMNPGFAEHVEAFIESLFDPSTFLPKVTSGSAVTGNSLFHHFEEYIKIFNSDTMPTTEQLNQATVAIQNQAIINECLANYEAAIQRSFTRDSDNQREFFLESDQEEAHKNAEQEALQRFKKARKMGGQKELKEFTEALRSRLKEAYKSFTIKNKNSRFNAIQKAIKNLKKYFTESMNTTLTEMFQGNDDFVLDDKFQIIHQDCKTNTERELLKQLHLRSFQELLQEEQTALETSIISWMTPIKETNLERKSSGLKKLNSMVSALSDQHELQINKFISQFKYWTQEDLQSLHQEVSKSLIEQFKQHYGDSSLFQEGEKRLVKELTRNLKIVSDKAELRNAHFLSDCQQTVTNLVKSYTDKIEQNLMELSMSNTKTLQEHIQSCKNELEGSSNFNRLPVSEAQVLLSDLADRLRNSFDVVFQRAYPLKRNELLKKYKDEIISFYGDNMVFDENNLNQKLILEKEAAIKEFSILLRDVPSQREKQVSASEKLEDFEHEIDTFIKEIVDSNRQRGEALRKNITGYYWKAVGEYTKKINGINEAFHSTADFEKLSHEAKTVTTYEFEHDCKTNTGDLAPEEFLRNLETFMGGVPKFTRVGNDNDTLQITGPLLKFSSELRTSQKIKNPEELIIQSVHWIASERMELDENLCGEFWSGKNLVICAPYIKVIGFERIIDVSGKKGKSARMNILPPPIKQYGACGINGENGDPGESGGNVAIVAHRILNGHNLCITSNGGAGGDGQPGGAGSPGKNGVDGDLRFDMSLVELQAKFPSPAKFLGSQRTLHINHGYESLEQLAKGVDVESKNQLYNEQSKYWKLTTSAGAVIRYAFFEGLLKGAIGQRSFYVWCQGAHGTNGQPGGIGGHGGKGGRPGNPGHVYYPPSYEGEIDITTQLGIYGMTGQRGVNGKDGTHGKQGTDYAYLDPYAGWDVISSNYPIREFSGNLDIQIGRKADGGNWTAFKDTAYCPYKQTSVTFVQSNVARAVQKVYGEPEQPAQEVAAKAPVVKDPIIDIDIETFKAKLNRAEKVIVGNNYPNL